MYLIAINGAPQAGKSHFAIEVEEALVKAGIDCHRLPIISILRDMLFQFADRYQGTTLPRTMAMYNVLKQTQMHGALGRDWQIAWGDSMRGLNQDIFVNDFIQRMRNQHAAFQTEVFICDDLGLPREAEVLHEHQLITPRIIYLDERGYKGYVHGQMFNGDCRACLRGIADFTNPSVEVIVEDVKRHAKIHALN